VRLQRFPFVGREEERGGDNRAFDRSPATRVANLLAALGPESGEHCDFPVEDRPGGSGVEERKELLVELGDLKAHEDFGARLKVAAGRIAEPG
jgi:hypothetical protein